MKNLLGKPIGKWTIIKKLEQRTKDGKVLWECMCSCGNVASVRQSDLTNGKSTQCKNCSAYQKASRFRAELSGKKFGKWTVIERVGTTRYRRPIWLCKCECGKTGKIPSSNLINGKSTKCGKCNHYKDMVGRVWSKIKNSAKKRDIKIIITIKEAYDLYVSQNGLCKLTGRKIYFRESSSDEQTASLDRIDSNLPYTKENCQWIHKDVNRMKWVFNNEQFINICKEVCKYNE